LSGEIIIIIDASKKDDKVDADGDGIADASQISGRELMRRKVTLVLTKMDPEKVNNAIASIYKGALGGCVDASLYSSFRTLREISQILFFQCG
jgi:hypothetical protein